VSLEGVDVAISLSGRAHTNVPLPHCNVRDAAEPEEERGDARAVGRVPAEDARRLPVNKPARGKKRKKRALCKMEEEKGKKKLGRKVISR